MKKKTKSILKLSILFLIILIVLFFSTYIILTLVEVQQTTLAFESKNIDDIVNRCKNLPLSKTCDCISKEVGKIFIYNITNINRALTFEELKEQGGVCWQYAELYRTLGEDLGFYSKKLDIDTNETMAHVFTIISNEEGYCLLDGALYVYIEFENE